MPRIPTIISQESPLAGAPQSVATGEDFGAGIGRAIQGLGSTIQQVGADFGAIGARNQAQKDMIDVATATANSSYAEPFNQTVNDYPNPDGAGLTQTISDGYDGYMNAQLEAFSKTGASKKAQDAYRLQLLQDKEMYVRKAAENQYSLANTHAKVQTETGLSTITNDVLTGGLTDETDFNLQLSKGIQLLSVQPGFNATDKEAGIRKFTSDLASARFTAMTDSATTLDTIEDIEKELADPRWEARFGTVEYEQQKRYLETARTSIQTETRALYESTIGNLSARAGNVVIPADEMAEAENTLANGGVPPSAKQLRDWRDIQIKNNKLIELQGGTAGDAHTATTAKQLGITGGPVRITYANRNSIRNLPVTRQLGGIYTQAASAAGIDEVRVMSGGQPATGPHRTGSHRHDHGNAGDIMLYKNGRPLSINDPNDLPYIKSFIANAWKMGATGIGAGTAYMGPYTLHVGFGSTAVWGAGGSGANAPQWLREVTLGAGAPGYGGGGPGIRLLPAAQQQVVTSVGNRYGIAPDLLAGMWRQESGGKVSGVGVSTAGAQGPFQFTPDTWAQYGRGGDINDFNTAADAAGRYMADLMKQFHGDTKLALMAYNWGPGSVREWIKEGADPNAVPDETKDYVDKVLGYSSGGEATLANTGGVTADDYTAQQVANRFITDQKTGLNNGVMDYIQTPDGGGSQITPMTLASTPEEIAQREQDFEFAKSKYDLTQDQMKPLTQAEVNNLTDLMASNDPAKLAQVLGMFDGWSKQNQEYAFAQIGQKDVVAGVAGSLWAGGQQDLAFEALQGRGAYNAMKDQGDVKWQTNPGGTDEIFRTEINLGQFRGLDPEFVSGLKATADAIMAQRIRRGAKTEIDPEEYKQIWAELLGKQTGSVNGAETILPQDVEPEDMHAVLSVMTTEDWAMRSREGNPPLDKNGEILEGWQLEGAQLFVINSEDDYEVVVDGEPVMTMGIDPDTGQPTPQHMILHVEAEWIGDTLAKAEAGIVPAGTGANPDGTLQPYDLPPGIGVAPSFKEMTPSALDLGEVTERGKPATRVPTETPPASDVFPSTDIYGTSGSPFKAGGSGGNDTLEDTGTYTVRRGDNLTKIAKKLGLKDFKGIQQANGIKDEDVIAEGQVLKIPGLKQANVPNPRPRPGTRDVPGIPNPPMRPARDQRNRTANSELTPAQREAVAMRILPGNGQNVAAVRAAQQRFLTPEQQQKVKTYNTAKAIGDRMHAGVIERSVASYRARLVAGGKLSNETIDKLVKQFRSMLAKP